MRSEHIRRNWYKYIAGLLLGLQCAVFLIFRDNSYLQVHDNLDLFMAHYEMLKKGGLWFAHSADAPILHGISRDLFGSEFNLYNILYVILPGIWAYLTGYALKTAIGIFSFTLLAKDLLGAGYERYRPVITLSAVCFGLIPVFPAYGIAFTSVPLIVYLLRQVYLRRDEPVSKRIIIYAAIFCYPLVSYFSYHGFFILCYMCVAMVILWIRDRRFPLSIFISTVLLSLGYILWEYRLFGAMLFDDTVTIRTTMEHGELTLGEALKTGLDEFINASFHSEDSHTYIVLPLVLIALIIINVIHLRKKEYRRILTDPINLVMLWILFNVLIFGLYQYEPFRRLLETLVPKLTGFEFARTAYFNTFLWYAELALVCMRMYDSDRPRIKTAANVALTAAVIIVMFVPQVYNDFYYTCYNYAYKLIRQKETSTVNYREFYSEDLFDEIKDSIDYDGEWSAAYGMHPAVLNYNGIATVDGYLGFYPQEYKDKWERVEAPAFEGSPSIRDYFTGWGARVCLYSGSDENTYAPLREMDLSDKRLMVDMNELKSLDCRYIFSRIRFENETELGTELVGEYSGEGSPYVIYVYSIPKKED